MDIKKDIFTARVCGRPIELKRCYRRKTRTEQVIALWKHDVIEWDVLSRGENGAIFKMLDSVTFNGFVETEMLSEGYRILFGGLDLVKLLEFRLVKEQING